MREKQIGAQYISGESLKFSVWAPFANKVQLVFKNSAEGMEMEKNPFGYWEITLPENLCDTLYKFRINEEDVFPDPASRSQPFGVHSWSETINLNSFSWSDDSWSGIPVSEMLIYELHVGTFSEKGTFKGVAEKLDYLLELGINTIEIMPVAQFPGDRNWGYDGVYPFAVQNGYGGSEGLQHLINVCHQKGIAVVLDVVYNHLGPEGNYMGQFGPYFTEKYKTPWGSAINFDDEYSDEVRNFFLENTRMWLEDYHLDGLRLDAVHEIIDRGAKHFLKELSLLADKVEEKTGNKRVLIAESDLNDSRLVSSYTKGGYALEAQWVDDFHHSLHTLITGEESGYYSDFGKLEFLAKSFKQAFLYDGVYSDFRKKTVGNSPKDLLPQNFVVCNQNHDQIGNRVLGERLSSLVSLEKMKLATGILLISPFVPMLFMGEEFAEDQPFQYFVSHGDADLVKAVQEGRKREFRYFLDSEDDFPDPQSEKTFKRSKLNWDFRKNNTKENIFEYYKFLLKLRKEKAFQAFRNPALKVVAYEQEQLIKVTVPGEEKLVAVFNFNSEETNFEVPESELGKNWDLIFASADKKWQGPATFPEKLNFEENIHLPAFSMIVLGLKN